MDTCSHSTSKPWVPVMFCASNCFQELWTDPDKLRESIDSLNPWPKWSQIRFSMGTCESAPAWVTDVIHQALQDWIDSLGPRLDAVWVSENEISHIRISFRSDIPSWSCIGNTAPLCKKGTPTMNFNLGGWKDSKTVYAPVHVKRLAYHLFGHALGLPHAVSSTPSPWNYEEVKKVCGSSYAKLLESAEGCSQLRGAQSIMCCDIPCHLNRDGKVFLQGSNTIDQEAIALLRTMHPPVMEPSCLSISTEQLEEFHPGCDGRAQGNVQVKTPCTANIIIGFRRMDMGLNDNFRFDSYLHSIQPGSMFTLHMGAWYNTYMDQATCTLLSFDRADQRVRTGCVDWQCMSDVKERSFHQEFSPPFRIKPKVAVFINFFDTMKGKWLCASVEPSDINEKGFTITLKSWKDNYVYSVKAMWLAHDAADWTIRSGLVAPSFDPCTTKTVQTVALLDPPLTQRPRSLFYGFSHIESPPDINFRLEMEARCDKTKVEARFSTWTDNSWLYSCKGYYIAIL